MTEKLVSIVGSLQFRWYPPREIRVSTPAAVRRIKAENAEELAKQVELLLKSSHIMGTTCKVERAGHLVWAKCGDIHIEFYGQEPQVAVKKGDLEITTSVEEIAGAEDSLTFKGSTFNVRVAPILNKVEIQGKETLSGFALIKKASIREKIELEQ